MRSLRTFSATALMAVVLASAAPGANAQDPDSVAAQDSLLLQLQAEMGALQPEPPRQQVTRSRPTTNPDISVIGDTRAWAASKGERSVDLELHEVETALRSVVDPYARADVYISAKNDDGEIVFELEEAYLTTLALPFQIQVKAGKFRSNVGKINHTHPHALPFPDTPSVYENFLGEDGLNDQGVGINWLVPNASFYQELSLEITRGPGESASFEPSESNRLLYTAHLKNFWDLSDDATFEFGLSGLAGPNAAGMTTWMGGLDATFKWKPVQFNTYHSFTAQMETLFSRMEREAGDVTSWGMYALSSYQLSRRWLLTGRFDHSDLPGNADWNENGISLALAVYLTEFQKIELGIRHAWGPEIETVTSAIVRAIFVIGTHGAHQY